MSRRLALDIMSLVRNAGRATPSGCRRLRADEGLRRWLQALGPADVPDWDDLRRHIRSESHRLGLPEIDAVRELIPTWRAQGMLLGAVQQCVQRQDEDGEPIKSGATTTGYDVAENFGGNGFGFGA